MKVYVGIALFCVFSFQPSFAQSWMGAVNGTKLEITVRGDDKKGRSFDVFLDGGKAPIRVKNCGYVDLIGEKAINCADDLNRFTGPTMPTTASNLFSVRFGTNIQDFSCVAATADSQMRCVVKAKRELAFGQHVYPLVNLRSRP